MKPQIVLEFHKDGRIEIQPSGFSGGACKDATRFLEEALGKVVKEEPTPEAYLANVEEDTTATTGH